MHKTNYDGGKAYTSDIHIYTLVYTLVILMKNLLSHCFLMKFLENQDIHEPFCYEIDTAFILQNIPSENQDLYVIFYQETATCLYFEGYAL